MSRFHTGIAALGTSLLLLAITPSSPAQALGLHIRIGGGPIGVVRSIASMALGGLGGLRGRRGARVRMARAEAANSASRMDITRGPDWVTRPVARVQVAAMAALAGWHGQRGTKGWWQHGDGGYGWVGPLFWPFAYYDIYDYTLWGDGMGFWGYGYRDIYAAIFTPYDGDELLRYASPSRGRKFRHFPSLTRICGADASELAGLPVEQVKQAMGPSTEEQRAALDDLVSASIEAAQTIQSACLTEVGLTPSDRLAEMQRRLEAMKSVIARVQKPFETFYDLLDDDQKGKLAAFANQRTPFAPKVPAEQSCTPPGTLPWPKSEIEAKLHLNEWQRDELDVVQRMIGFATDTLNLNCQPDETLSPPARLATADARLDVMLNAIKLVRPALDDFFATLNEEQKAQFETIGAKRTS
ncbi:MAG TPA: Spy/CpxP family protein refolding chaperone [Bradyrhizobium sp.]|uniref:Spy/CpxP family protein refolding chaperone n=1 Tax=Bradyrhizobium sp. TaxID=376 RepID=UPI002BA2227A|nr:Spy/CpxP family protein refolding chaperone [Bradyrhizobium sp.]HLZ02707.1 Spy/CpxP family protein refolding chaperone [Bradyrhizobium sp.]